MSGNTSINLEPVQQDIDLDRRTVDRPQLHGYQTRSVQNATKYLCV
jgi:hypothetical protein